MICFRTFSTIFLISSSGFSNCFINVGIIDFVYLLAWFESINAMMKPIAFKNAPNDLSLIFVIWLYRGIKTSSKAYIPYGAEASAKEPKARAVIDLTFFCWSSKPCLIASTNFFKWGKMEHPIKIAICWIILIPVCLASQLFLLAQTAFKKGRRASIPKALATTANALEVVFLTNSSLWSMSFLIVFIIVGKPAAFVKLLMIYLPYTLA